MLTQNRTTRRRVYRAITLVAAIATTSTVSAQQPLLRDSAPLEDPTYPGWVFTPSLATGGTWDDNLILAHENDVVLRDYGTPIQPSLRLEHRSRRTLVTTNYDGSFLVYRDLTELNSSQHVADFRLRHLITPQIAMRIHESFAKVPTTDAFSFGGVPFFRIGARTNDVGGGLEANLSRNTSLDLAYTLTSVEFENSRTVGASSQGGQLQTGPVQNGQALTEQLHGGYVHMGSIALSHKFSPRFTLGTRYQLRQAVLAQGADRFNIQDATIISEYLMTKTTALSLSAGVARLDASADHEERTGPSVGVTISRRLPRSTMLTAGYQRSFIPSWGFGGTFQNQEWLLNLRVPFARNRAYFDTRSAWLEADPLDTSQPSLRSLWLGTTLGYRATRWLSLEVFYDGTGQDTHRPGGNRRRNLYGFRIVTAKPMKVG